MSLGQSSRFSDHVLALSSQRTRPLIAGTSIHYPALNLGHIAVVRWMEALLQQRFHNLLDGGESIHETDHVPVVHRPGSVVKLLSD